VLLRLRATLVGLSIWALAASSLAGTLQVQFALSGQVVVSPSMVSTPGSTTGLATVVLTGVNSFGAITDRNATATILGLTLQAGFSAGPLQFSQKGPATNTFFIGAATDLLGPGAGAAFGIAPAGLTLQLTRGLVGGINFTNQMAVAVQIASIGMSGASQLMFSGSFGPSDVTAQFNLLGREVARNFAAVPEPVESGLLATGLALIAAGTWIFRGRRVDL
jgi:hypothetical protein